MNHRRIVSLGFLAQFALGALGCNLMAKKKAPDTEAESEEEDAPKKKKKRKADEDSVATPVPALDPFVARHLELASSAAKCGTADAVEPWCLAAKGFAAGKPGMPGIGTKLGLTTFVVTKDANLGTLRKYQHVSALAFRKDGSSAFAWITEVKGSTPRENTDLESVAADLLDFFGNKGKKVKVKSDLANYLDGLPKGAQFVLRAHDAGYSLQGGSFADLRRVGSFWVAVEVPRKDPAGIYLNVFGEVEYR